MLSKLESSDFNAPTTSGCVFDIPVKNESFETSREATSSIFRRYVATSAIIFPLALHLSFSNPNLSVDDDFLFAPSNSNHTFSFGSVGEGVNITEEYYLQSFVNFLEDQIDSNSELVVPVDVEQLNRISQLIEGVDVE